MVERSTFLLIKDLQYKVLSYLPGCDLLHKISLLSKGIRFEIPRAGLLNQLIVLVVKEFKSGVVTIPPLSSFEYALSFADVIHLQVDAETVTVASSFLSLIMMKNR